MSGRCDCLQPPEDVKSVYTYLAFHFVEIFLMWPSKFLMATLAAMRKYLMRITALALFTKVKVQTLLNTLYLLCCAYIS